MDDYLKNCPRCGESTMTLFDYGYFSYSCTNNNCDWELEYDEDGPLGHQEYKYLDLLNNIINHGKEHKDRTGVGTLRIFGPHLEFDLSDGRLPLLTTKKVFWKGVVDEYVFFFSGHTNIKDLPERSRHWWDKWTTNEGDIGPLYPKQYRKAEAIIHGERNWTYEFDQFAWFVNEIKSNPDSRRLLLSSYSPAETHWARAKDPQLLFVCHGLITQANVENGVLSLSTYQRSADYGVGFPINLAHYSLLLFALCQETGLKPGKLIYNIGDCHVYKNHVEAVKTQLAREPFEWPTVEFSDTFNILAPKAEDIKLIGYKSHPAIKLEVAV